jgi:hypothetical protein
MTRPIHSDPEWMQIFLRRAATYFENRPTDGEDRAYWSNVYNAENCRKIADEIERLRKDNNKLREIMWNIIYETKCALEEESDERHC